VSDFVSTVAWIDSEGEVLGSQPNTHIAGTFGNQIDYFVFNLREYCCR
jgi:hypothetical protein